MTRWNDRSSAASERRRLVLAAAFALALTSPASAQFGPPAGEVDSPGLTVEATAGWDGTVDQATPVPVSLLLKNETDRIVEGRLALSDPMNGYQVDLGEVFVSPHSTRRVTSIQNLGDWFECFATLSDGERTLWRLELALSTGNDFAANVNFALLMDDGGRQLQFPGAISDTAAVAATDAVVAPESGRPVKCLTVKSWQVPNHFGPLAVAQAIVFPEEADADALNRVQWRAAAEWTSQGGTVFVHRDSQEIVDRLMRFAPTDDGPATPSGEFLVRRVGLGAVYEYSHDLFSSDGSEVRRRIGETVAKLPKQQINSLIGTADVHRRRGGQADVNRILIVVFFGSYMLLSGAVTMLLFRLNRQRIAAYTVVVVAGACVLSALLGGHLRFSPGDLRWISVTQAGTGGVVQVARIEVQSAGGRSTRVAVTGERPDLQYAGRVRRYRPWHQAPKGFPPFTWQPSLAKAAEDAYQINVPMTPWGRRRLHATGFRRGLQPMDFALNFEPSRPPAGSRPDGPATLESTAGQFTLKLVNRLPHAVSEGWLIVGTSQPGPSPGSSGQVVAMNSLQGQSASPLPATPGTTGPTDVYHMERLQPLAAGAALQMTFASNFRLMRDDWEMVRSWTEGSLTPPRLSRIGTASAWIIARLETSPILSIDTERSDFVLLDELHLFVQELPPEDMPDGFTSHRAADPKDADSAESPAP